MDIKLFTQPKTCDGENYSLGEQIELLLSSNSPKFTDATFFFGLVKDNAFDKIFEYIKSYILSGGNLKFYLSQPQKGNMKKVINYLNKFSRYLKMKEKILFLIFSIRV